ncbi:hypothetical protein SLS55_001335 [Diplodia seriata]|uniref:Uncharacterized protein n=1 Tax=Diplodia seriata TaxID=420778 RepID=A0ABR3CXW3_9PEZI
MHLIQSGHGSYHVLWDEPPAHHLKRSNTDATSASPDEDAQEAESPQGLDRVNTKLEEWSFAARECTALDKTRSHPHFQPYVEVFQDDYEPQFAMDVDSDALFMAPPNSKRHTPASSNWASRRGSETESEHTGRASPAVCRSILRSDSSSSYDMNGPQEQQEEDTHDPLTVSHQLRDNDDVLFTSGYYSPRPNDFLTPSDRSRSQDGSPSDFSNTSDMSDNATSLLANHRDSVVLLSERRSDELPVNNPWAHRDSVAVAKERIKKKHANETGEALVSGVGILKGVGKGSVERTAPLNIPRLQQVTLMGVMSPIADASPPNAETWDDECERSIDDLAERW